MRWQQLQQQISLDKCLLFIVATGCTATIYEARQEGRQPLKGQLLASQCRAKGTSRLVFTSSLCRQLEEKGYVVVDDFLTQKEVTEARHSALALDWQESPNERDGDAVRTDKVFFFQKNSHGRMHQEEPLLFVQDQLYRLGFDVFKSSFSGFGNDGYVGSRLAVPPMMQVSLYDKIDTEGAEESEKRNGAFYRSHLDTCSDSIFSMGYLGWLRSHYLRKRYITCLLYLNPGWKQEDGGCLRIFEKDGQHFVDVEPVAGRLVIFSSVHTWHAVLPTFAPRVACSMWFTIDKLT